MPPVEPTQYIRTLKLTMLWSAIMAGTPDEVKRVCDALNASRVQLEREIETCVDDGLRGKKLEDTNTRARITTLFNELQLELSVQITFASLVAETVEQVMTVAHKLDECAGAVLRSHARRLDERVVEQRRQVRLVRVPAMVVPAPVSDAPADDQHAQRMRVWLIVNSAIALMALVGVLILFLLLLLTQR